MQQKREVGNKTEKMQRFFIRMLGLIILLADVFVSKLNGNYLDAYIFLEITYFKAFFVLGLILFVFPSILLTVINALETAGAHFRDGQ